MFGKHAVSELSPGQVDSINHAAELLGIGPAKLRRDGVEFTHKGEKLSVEYAPLRRAFVDMAAGATLPILGLAELLDVTPPTALLEDFERIKPLLRPRLLHPRELSGPRRAMCRREAADGLLIAVAVGRGYAAHMVTTGLLDAWGIEFEEVLAVSRMNLASVLSAKNLHDVTSAPGVLALVHKEEQVAGAALILDELFPPEFAVHGVVYSTPREDVMLVLPVSPDGGADGLAAMVQATFSMAHARGMPLSEHLYWWREGRPEHLPMITVEEGKSRRIHLEARGAVDELLRILGAIE